MPSCDTDGITDSDGIIQAAQGAAGGVPMTCFTFGFGSDHSESLLRALSEQSNGLYYYVAKSEDIPLSFADCLGGLVSVVAQNAELLLEGVDECIVSAAHCHYKQSVSPPAITLELGDIYAEDEKDVLCTLSLPALAAVRFPAAPAMRASLRYFSVEHSRMETVSSELLISRPEVTPLGQPLPARLAEQRERVAVAEAMQRAAALADGGQIAEGRAILQAAVVHAEQSPSADSAVVRGLIEDANRVEPGYEDAAAYSNFGSKMTMMNMMSNLQQRSTHAAGGAYEKRSKKAMKEAFHSAQTSDPHNSSVQQGFVGQSSSSTTSSPSAATNSPLRVKKTQSKSDISMIMPSFRSNALQSRNAMDNTMDME